MDESRPPRLVKVEDCLWICEERIEVPGYDFAFHECFACSHPVFLECETTAVARMGAAKDYRKRYEQLLEWNVRLLHSPEEYDRTSYLPNWYPRIKDFTPKSLWYDHLPSIAEIESEFEWPVFLKGERQTSKHNRRLSIIENTAQYMEAMEAWRRDPILHWQRVVCRQYVNLRRVARDLGQEMPKAFEFRTFWWRDSCVGAGPYWHSETYSLNAEEKAGLLRVGTEVARRMNVTFLVIDLAMSDTGEWIVIECNDGQDSGYAGVNRFAMWSNVVRVLKQGGEACV